MTSPNRYQTAQRVTVVNSVANVALAFFKVGVGYWGHSQALVVDGIHSFSDLISDALVLIAAKMGGRTPDAEHPYGHQRIETVAAMVIAILLLVVGGSIIYESYSRVTQGQHIAMHGFLIILAAIISIVIKEWLYRYT